MKTKYIYTLLVLCLMALVACGSKLTAENFAKIETGMKEEQVKEILGEPNKVATSDTMGILKGATYHYQSGQSTAKIVFVNGGVLTKEAEFK